MIKTMKSFTVSVKPETFEQLNELTDKHKTSRSKIVKAILALAMRDKVIMQKAVDIL